MRNIIATLAFITLTGTALAQSVTITATPQTVNPPPPPPPPPPGNACAQADSGFGASLGLSCDTSASDDFNGSSVDTSKWQITGGIPSGLPGPLCSPAATESGGYLHIPVGGPAHCTGMAVATSPIFKNSGVGRSDYTEIRMSFPAPVAGQGSYWSIAKTPANQVYAEIDLMNESCPSNCMQNNWFAWTVEPNAWNPIGGAADDTIVPGAHDTNIHVMGLYRNGANQTLNFYWDNTLYKTYNAPYSGQYGYGSGQSAWINNDMQPIFVECATGCDSQFDGSSSGEALVDYIHYYH